MFCPKCGSGFVTVQVVNDVRLKNVHHGVLWWLLVGWWWVIIKWTFFTLPALLFAVFGHKKQKLVNTGRTVAICQSCGATWDVPR